MTFLVANYSCLPTQMSNRLRVKEVSNEWIQSFKAQWDCDSLSLVQWFNKNVTARLMLAKRVRSLTGPAEEH